MANQRTDTESVVNLVINGKQAMTSLKELTDTQRRLNTEVRNMRPTDQGYPERLRELQMINQAMEEQRNILRGVNEETSNWKDIAAGVFGGNLLESGLNFVLDGISKMKDAYAESEKNRSVLTNAFKGDAKQANESLQMLMEFAAKTPFALQEATDAYLKMVNRGITPTKEEMVKLGDVAASQGKSLDQYVEAILDAQTGENERLKELGIRATKNGDMVSFSFKGITKEVKNTETAIYKALLGFGELDGVSGSMEAVSKTIVGLQSNIEDTWDQIFTKMGQKSEGFISGFYQSYSSVLSYISEDLLSTESNAQKLTKEFKNQAAEVVNLEKNVNPLLDRYDELKAKGKLNKDEQVDLKNVLSQIATTIPTAITQWDKYGNALGANTKKAREFIKIQRVMLQATNKEAVDSAQKEIADMTKKRDDYLKTLNRGTLISVTQGSSFGTGARESKIAMTDKETTEYRNLVLKYNAQIEERRLLIKGLNGDYMDELLNPKKEDAEVLSTARTEGVIKKEIDALKKLRAEMDIHSKEYAVTGEKIKKLDEELAGASGKKTAAQKKEESDKQKALKEFEKLDKDYEKLGIAHLDDQLSKNQKEIDQEGRKYDELIKKEQDFLKLKGATPEQKKATEVKITSIKSDKKKALDDLALRQEDELLKKIAVLRQNFAKVQESELEKQKVQINSFYDGLEKESAGNETKIAELKLARKLDLSDAELRQKERLEKEKAKIESDYNTLSGDKDADNLAKLNQKYDDEIQALRDKFSKEIQATQEFQDAIDAINKNRKAEIAKTEAEEKKETKDLVLESVQKTADATFNIMSANRKRETDLKLSSLEKDRNAELSKKNLTEKQKDAINKKYDEKSKAIKLKAWKDDKAASLAQAVINGALAVTKALPNIPLAIAAGVAAAAEIAVIVATKPPEFSVGVRNFKGGPALVGEEGPEAINENGKWWIARAATLTDLEPGADVYTASDTAQLMKGRSLGEKTYVQSSYTIDDTAVRSAERNYRTAGATGYTSTSTAAAPSAPANTGSDLSDMKTMLAKMMAIQQSEMEKPVNLYYQKLEEFGKAIKEVRVSQGG